MEILNQSEVYTNNDIVDLFFIIALFLGIIIAIFALGAVFNSDFTSSAVLGFISAGLLFGAYAMSDHVLAKHTEYEVLVTDLNEVYEQGYEIVENRGKITVIREVTE